MSETLANEIRVACDCTNCRMCGRIQELHGKMAKAADALDAKDARIAELEAALRDVRRQNDHPARYNAEIDAACATALGMEPQG